MADAIYLDHAATTPLAPEVLEAMSPFLGEQFGNPASIYGLARGARRALDDARESVADHLGCRAGEIVFTSGGTEADNLAIKGVAFANRARGQHIVTSRIEHLAVLRSCEYLQKLGFEVTYVEVDRHGRVDPGAVADAIRADTTLISIMLANNEVGTIEPLKEIGAVARARGVPLHTDACQAAGALALDVDALGVDLLSLSAHKLYGPKGSGALYVRRGVQYHNLLHGGSNERGRRAGTENVAGIVGLAAALRLAERERESVNAHLAALRDRLVAAVGARVAGAELMGHPTERLPAFASFVLEGIEGESMLLALDARNVFASSGAACTSGTLDPSHVLTAMGVPAALAHGSLRLTVGLTNTEEQIDRAAGELAEVVAKLRSLAPTRSG